MGNLEVFLGQTNEAISKILQLVRRRVPCYCRYFNPIHSKYR
ncbi:hypothetical protein NIES2104_54310 [Leptolyngbya sp. NIES-2104]|nr:hypothetical protein NIES2104_54310 [Leptolyngbya sp. NIES-2104]